jgi:hypothetical protein
LKLPALKGGLAGQVPVKGQSDDGEGGQAFMALQKTEGLYSLELRFLSQLFTHRFK